MSSDDRPARTGPAPARPQQRRLRDMALSLAVLLVPLAIFLGIWKWAASDRQVTVADTAEDYATADSLGLEAIRPDLPKEWRPISSALAADEAAVTLRTGWYSPQGAGLQLVQTTGAPEAVSEEIAGIGAPVEAAGIAWASHDLAHGEAWVAEVNGFIVVLVADPDGVGELPELAEGVAAGA